MKTGISTACYYPMYTEKALQELIEAGVKGVEIFFNATDEISGKIYREIEAMVRSNEVSVHSVHPFSSAMETVYLFSDYDRRSDELLDVYRRYFETMNRLGAKVFVLHGALASAICPDDFYFRQYSKLFRLGKQFGVTVAQENICYCKSKSLDFLKKMSRQLGDECAFVLDLKQAHRSGLTPFEIMDALGKKICHYHISDRNDIEDCMPAGKGSFDFDRFFEKLKQLDYDGAIILELYRTNFENTRDLLESMSFLRGKAEKFLKIT